MPLILGSNAPTGGYEVDNSLRFNSGSSDYLSRTPATTGTSRQIMTFSFWTKRSGFETTNAYRLFSTFYGGGASQFWIRFADSGEGIDKISIVSYDSGFSIQLITTQVFRDPSAWYHVVVAFDTTQATSTNRVKLYINGSQVTSFSTSTYPSLNYNLQWNVTQSNQIGGNGVSGNEYYNGYMSEVCFIDGQQLDPTSFGEFDANSGIWKPIDVSGLTFGTNGFYLDFSASGTASYVGTFDGSSQYGSIASGSITNAGTGDYTLEAFVKLDTSGDNFLIGGTGTCLQARINSSNKLDISRAGSPALTQSTGTVTVGKWTHLAWVRSGSTLTYYIDGVASGTATDNNNYTGSTVNIGATNNNAGSYGLDGQVNNLRFVKDVVYTSDFTPPTSNLTDITNTTLLTCQSATFVDNSSVGSSITNNGSVSFALDYPFNNPDIANDESGNGNDFTAINLTTGDITTDTPTNNFATMNPLARINGSGSLPTFSEGNLQLTTSDATARFGIGSIATTMKYYFEVKITSLSASDSGQRIGIVSENSISTSTDYSSFYQAGGVITATGESNDSGSSWSVNDIIGVAVDMADSNTIKYYLNGSLQATMSVGASYQSLSTVPVTRQINATNTFQMNFGNPPFAISSGNSDADGYGNFEYAVPSGYYALNTKNLAEYG